MTDSKKSTKVKLYGSSKAALINDFVSWFAAYRESRKVKALKGKIGWFIERTEFTPETAASSKKTISALKKEVDTLKDEINVPVQQIRDLNMAIIKPMLDDLENKRKALGQAAAKYNFEQSRIQAEKQAEEDRRFAAAQKLAEDQRKAAAAKAEEERQAGKETEPVYIAEPVKTYVQVDTVAKSVVPDKIDVEITNTIDLARYLLGRSGEISKTRRTEMFLDIFKNTLIKPIQDVIRSNEGNQSIVNDLRKAGVNLDIRGYGVK